MTANLLPNVIAAGAALTQPAEALARYWSWRQVARRKPASVDGMTRTPFGALIVVALASAFAATWPFRGDLAQSVAVATMQRPLAQAMSWRFLPGVSLTQVNIERLASDAADLLVVGDVISPDGSQLSSSDVVALQDRPSARRRIVLAHINLAAVSVRDVFWDPVWSIARPGWFDAPLCDAVQSYPVKFWNDDWKKIIVSGPGSEIDRITALGFNGVYLTGLDRVDDVEGAHPPAKRNMIRLITELAAKARSKRPGFIVMVEAQPAFLADAELRGAIDGTALHGALYGTDGRERRRAPEIAQAYEALRPLQYDGKTVFAVEIVTNDAFIERAALELRRRGIVPGFEAPESTPSGLRECSADATRNQAQ